MPWTGRALCVGGLCWCVVCEGSYTMVCFERWGRGERQNRHPHRRHRRRSSLSSKQTRQAPSPSHALTHAHTLHTWTGSRGRAGRRRCGRSLSRSPFLVLFATRLACFCALPWTTTAPAQAHKARDSSAELITPLPAAAATPSNHGLLHGRDRGHCPRAVAHPKPPAPGRLPLLSREQQEVHFYLPLRDCLVLDVLGLA